MTLEKMSPEALERHYRINDARGDEIVRVVGNLIPRSARAIEVYQALALAALAAPYNRADARILEIGTAQGYSAAVLALACPLATIITLNPHDSEPAIARDNFARGNITNVEVVEQRSVDYLKAHPDDRFDFIFVDGDHKNVRLDFPYWNLLNVDGMIVFHDYSPEGSPRACPPVYRALNSFRNTLGRDFDVQIIDDTDVGMVGWIKRADDVVSEDDAFKLAQAQANSSHDYETLHRFYALASAHGALEGDIVEVGVQNGGSLAALALGASKSPHAVFGFDTFAGVPNPEPIDGDKARTRYDATGGAWAVGEAKQVKALFKALGLKAPTLIEGDVLETLVERGAKGKPKFSAPIAILHVDATLYRATARALRQLLPLVAPGGVVIVSAYHHWHGVKEATDEVLATQSYAAIMHTIGKAVWWTVPRED